MMRNMLFALALVAGVAARVSSCSYTYERLDREKAVVVIVDHQVGLFSLVHDLEQNYFRQSVFAHAKIAQAFNLPVVMSTSAQSGPNGPLPKEIRDMFPDAPLIPRPGQINAMDNEDFVAALKATNRTQVIIGGIMTDVCTAFAALSMREAGYSVFAHVHASGTMDGLARDTSNDRMKDAGVQLLSTQAIFGELMRDWRTPPEEANPFLFLDEISSNMGMLIRSHTAAVLNGTLMPGQDEVPV